MTPDALNKVIVTTLKTMQSGCKIATAGTHDLMKDASNPEVKSALERGDRVTKQWTERITRALEIAGATGETDNGVLESVYKFGRTIRQEAPDDISRNLGIIADCQFGIHYWIAAFGTVRTYATASNLPEVAGLMDSSLKEAKEGDENFTRIATSLLSAT